MESVKFVRCDGSVAAKKGFVGMLVIIPKRGKKDTLLKQMKSGI